MTEPHSSLLLTLPGRDKLMPPDLGDVAIVAGRTFEIVEMSVDCDEMGGDPIYLCRVMPCDGAEAGARSFDFDPRDALADWQDEARRLLDAAAAHIEAARALVEGGP